MLASDEIERLERFSVEKERERYSNEQLWARLNEIAEREIEILQLIPIAYHRAFSWRSDYRSWRRYWNKLLNELSANQPVIELIIWHLIKREDGALSDWLRENERTKRELATKGQQYA